MAAIRSLIDRAGETVTWYKRTLGARDAITQWPEITFLAAGDFASDDFDCDDFFCDGSVDSIEITGMFKRIGIRETDQRAGRVTEVRLQMDTYQPVNHMDRVVYNDDIYEVESVPRDHDLRGAFRYRTCILIKVS